jgi:hypothetical protein
MMRERKSKRERRQNGLLLAKDEFQENAHPR